jgi:putative addiction module killer protein
MLEIREYLTAAGQSPFAAWLKGLPDRQARARIMTRLERLRHGNPGDVAAVGQGVSELRIHYGPGYRVYFATRGKQYVLLLGGGDKSSQRADINRAQDRWHDHQERVHD